MNTMTMAAAVSQVYRSSPGLMDKDIGWQPATLTVMKQEPMETEHLTSSPINDSGISPDHGSSGGSSAGRPSPGQQGGCDPRSSPDHRQQGSPDRTPIWGVSQLSPRGVPPKTSSPASVVSGNVLSMSMSTPVGFNRVPDHQQQCSPEMKPNWSVSQLSPQSAPPKTTSPSTGNPLAMPNGLNMGLSDDNSRSSSSMDGESLYSKSGLEQSPLRCLQMTVEKTTMSTQQKSEGSGGMGGPRHPFQCPLCEYNTISRTEFNDHLRAHYPDLKCDKCEFTTRHEDELLAHTRERHMSSPMEGGDIGEDGSGDTNSPQVTAQGKVKQYRCKQCSFVAVIKVEYWLHLRTHMRPDKILNCPRCLFATELKHHLEYHLRNHEQRKPYRCTECNYRCVNKSMLNSHLKSHSNVYQYRCASCSYATKYCHSLKLHLRKYDHTPDMVLNPDGTPNPHPIIDVYGTRRGPKQRPKLQATKQETPVTTSATMITPPQVSGIQLGMLQAPYGLLPPHRDLSLPYPFGSLMSNAFTINNNNSIMMEYNQNAQEKQTNITTPSENVFNNMLPAALLNNNVINKQIPLVDHKEQETQFVQERQSSVSENSHELETPAEKNLTGTPLDLSKPESVVLTPEPNTTIPVSQSSQISASKCTTKNRRKGQAFKLDNISRKLQQQCLSDQESVIKYQTDDKPRSPPQSEELETIEVKRNCDDKIKQIAVQGAPERTPTSVQSTPEVFHCSYCAITFGDPIMYTIHKGYHGFQDPFTCNMCGIQTSNRVEFFLHVARHPHC